MCSCVRGAARSLCEHVLEGRYQRTSSADSGKEATCLHIKLAARQEYLEEANEASLSSSGCSPECPPPKAFFWRSRRAPVRHAAPR